MADPFEFAEYRKRKIREKIEQSRPNRLQLNDLPSVNKEFALKLMNNQSNAKKTKASETLLKDDRFSAMFKNPDFEIDKNTEEFRLLNPVLSKLDKTKAKTMQKAVTSQFEMIDDDEKQESSDDLLSEYSSDDEHQWTQEVKKEHRKIQNEARRKAEMEQENNNDKQKDPKLYALKTGEEYNYNKGFKIKRNK